jgi:Xaa-Pro aminopeptidase
MGNQESPINYPDNPYPFRQDSSFLYFWGLNEPDLVAAIDIDEGRAIVFGDDAGLNAAVWTGSKPTLREMCSEFGVQSVEPLSRLESVAQKAQKSDRTIHLLPQYKAVNILNLSEWLQIPPGRLEEYVSKKFILGVVEQRSIKTEAEIEQIEVTFEVTYAMHLCAMQTTAPGIHEREVAGQMAGVAGSRGSGNMAYPPIFTVRGEVLHNPLHVNLMRAGDLAVNDSGAESAMGYANDITRTIPVGGRFSARQKDIYTLVLQAQTKAIQAIRPGVEYREVHRLSCETLAAGLKDLGLMKGDVQAAVRAGAHAMFFPHGIGHMLGLDVHDMEGLGENYVGYSDTIKRQEQFGLCYLRLARKLESGFIVTVEPGLYFIPQLIDQWRSENRHPDFIVYDKVESYKEFGGVRIEDNVLVTPEGCRILGKPIPKTVAEVEEVTT